MHLGSEATMEMNNDETAGGAQPFESATEMGLNNLEDPGSEYFDTVLFMVSSAYHKERATNSSTLFDSILQNAAFFLFFAIYLVCRYANQISFYGVLFSLPLTLVFLYFFINHAPFLFLEEDVNWIRRELRLLSAISEDAKEVVSISAYINERAQEIWGSTPCPGGITINRLDESEREWLAIAESKARTGKDFVTSFEKQKFRRDSRTNRISFAGITDNFHQILMLFNEVKGVKEGINQVIVKKKAEGINICESLERSRYNLMSLLRSPSYQGDEQKLMESKQRVAKAAALTSAILENISHFINRNRDLMRDGTTAEKIRSINFQLLLMLPFLIDLEGSQLESEIARAWVEEAEEIITEAHASINNLQEPACKTWWLPVISRWKARRKLKGVISNINTRFVELLERKDKYGFKFIRRDSSKVNTRFVELLERKDKYGFKFIRRDSSKVVFQSPHYTIYDTVASSVVNRMRNYLRQESGVLAEVFYEVTSLCDQLEKMQQLVDDAGIIDGRYNSRTVWLKQAENIVQSVDNSLETFMKNSHTVWRNHLLKTRAGIRFSREIDRIKQTISIFMRCINAFGIELREESNSVVGFEEDIQALVSRLTSSSQHEFIVSIAGISGIGKTTLANEVYKDQVVVDHFPCRTWVTLHDRNAIVVEEVAKALMKSLKLEKEEHYNSSWIQEVRDLLNEKRYLIVLDNIWTIDELDSLKAALLVPSSGSKILVTSIENNLGSPADGPPHQIQLRSTEESWKLLNQIVQFPREQRKLAKEILGICGGLPRSILRLGYLMSGKDVNSAEELRKILQYIRQNDTALIEFFTTRFIHSVPNLRSCLSYLKLFPRDFEIPVRRLISLWIAEGLVELSENNSETYEDVAHRYLKQLIDGGVIQVVERKHNGEVKKCRLPYALQKLNLKDMTSRRVTDHFNRTDKTFAHIHGESSSFSSSYRGTVSILSFDTREGNKPGAEIGRFLQRVIASWLFPQLKVLDLERVFRPELPDTIGRLSKLEYLGLRWTYLESIPSSIGNLHNLQTLDVKHTYIHTLPSSIWKLQKLRHLYLNQSYPSKLVRQQGGSSLKHLQTLWGVFVDKDSPLKDGLDKLLKLRKLGLAFELPLSDQMVLSEKIVKLKFLKTLRMRSIDEMGEPCDLFLKPLTGLKKLCSLNLFGKLNPSIIPGFPESLIDLTLSSSSLSDDPMPKLEKLPNLKLLCFYSKSFMGNKMTCSTLGFPQLVVLKLWKLENLQEWDVEEKAMQNLRELEIRSCKKLSVPSGLKHLITLNELKLNNMPEEFAAAIAKSRGKIWEGLNHSPAIIADNWESTE